MGKGKFRTLVLIGLGLVLGGCAHVFHIHVDAINDGRSLNNKTYVIVPGNTGVSSSDLHFKEYAGYVEKALALKGYVRAGEQQVPAIEIFLTYGVGSPHSRVRTQTVPVWGQKGTEITTSEHSYTNKDGSTNVTTTTDIVPEYGVTGYTTEQHVQTVYPKYVIIDAYKVNPDGENEKMEQLWKTTITGEGRSTDLRRIFPVFIAAASKHLGDNTFSKIVVPLTRNDSTYKKITGQIE